MKYQHKHKLKGDAIRAVEWNALSEAMAQVNQHIQTATIGGLKHLGIGTDTPQAELEVIGTTWTHDLLARNIRAGKIFINGKALDEVIGEVIGEAQAGSAQLSDARLKYNINHLADPLMRLMQLRPISYQWNSHHKVSHLPKTPRIGLVADEVEHIVPEAISYDSDGFRQVDYGGLTAMLIEVVQQQQHTISALVAKVKQLEATVSTTRFE